MAMFLVAVLLASSTTARAQPPDNAALIYYQAFVLCEKPDETMKELIFDFYVSGKIDPNEILTGHIEKNRHATDLVLKASEISRCDWGHDYSQGYDYSQIIGVSPPNPIRYIYFLIAAETKWLMDQGEVEKALDRCLKMLKIAGHEGNGTIAPWFHSVTMCKRAHLMIGDILGLMPPDVNKLKQLKRHLTETQTRFPSLASCVLQEAEYNAAVMNKDKAQVIIDLFENSLGGHLGEPMLKRIREGDGTFFRRNREYYLNCWAASIDTVESGLPYPEICTKLEDLRKQWSREANDNPDATITSLWYSGPPYASSVRQKTHANALKTAIDLYIVKARTGKLPDTLPAGSAPDLFSGKPFAYAKTEDGFILRCRVREDPRKDAHEYKFKVK
jgi:hypothetical protein